MTITIDVLWLQAQAEWLGLILLLLYAVWRFRCWCATYEARRMRAGVRRMMRDRRDRGIPT